MDDKSGYSRRRFFKIAGALGAGSILMSGGHAPAAETESEKPALPAQIPARPFGKTGVSVSCLALGGMFDIPSNQVLLKQALKWGVTYWDTADCYEGGNSERGIGQFLKKYPETRQKIFLVTKSDKYDPKGLSELLDRSLQRMNTDCIDLYLLHGISSPDQIGKDTGPWAEKAKSQGKIKFFGFSAHSNMEDLLLRASKLGWIDGIMMTYNFRLMRSERMRAAVDACSKAGIGLSAMKTQGGRSILFESEAELELADRFVKRGFTDAQARLKAVWEEPNIASICSQMPNMTILMSNVAAALDRTKLTSLDWELMDVFAMETSAGYCAGCTSLCEPALGHVAPVGDIMRFLMYHNSYGDVDRAKACFADIAGDVREGLAVIDFSRAEKMCPQKIKIGDLVRRAATILA